MNSGSPVYGEAAYDRIAPAYDRLIGMSPGYHFHLQSAADALVEKLPSLPDLTVIDLGCGTGASTDGLANSLGHRGYPFSLVGVDASSGMLAQAAAKPWPTWVSFVNGDAENLEFETESAAGLLAAHLLGAVEDRAAVLRSAWRVLAPGGVLVIQDYALAGPGPAGPSLAAAKRSRAIWTAASRGAAMPLSWAVGRDTTISRRRWRSVLAGDQLSDLIDRVQEAGFCDVQHRTVTGWRRNLLHTLRARKPE